MLQVQAAQDLKDNKAGNDNENYDTQGDHRNSMGYLKAGIMAPAGPWCRTRQGQSLGSVVFGFGGEEWLSKPLARHVSQGIHTPLPVSAAQVPV